MKHFRLSLLLLFLPCFLSAQYLLDDAVRLKKYFSPPTQSDIRQRPSLQESALEDSLVLSILKKYLSPGMPNDAENINGAFGGNPFIRIVVSSQNELSLLNRRGGSTQIPAATAGGSGFSVTNLADGLARFLVKRTKQELSMAFFNEFKDRIAKDPYLGNFCPLTKAQLAVIDAEVYQFNDYLESLREAFSADMTALPGSMERYLRDPDLCENCLQKPEGKVLTDLLHIAQQMVNGEAPVEMIGYLAKAESAIQSADSTLSDAKLFNMAGGLRFLNIVSESFQNPDSLGSKNTIMPWYTARKIRETLRDKVVLQIYLGLLWQTARDIKILNDAGNNTETMGELMKKAGTGGDLVQTWQKTILSFSELTQSLQFSLQSSGKTRTTVADDFFAYSQSLTDLLQAVNQTGRLMRGPLSREIIPSEYILLTRQCNALYFNVRQRNFAAAVGNVIYSLNLLHEDLLDREKTKASKALTQEEKDKFEKQRTKSEKARKGIATLLKYANFMAAIAEASSADEMERAIELFALPPGSSSMKKQPQRFSVALNAYTGFAAGAEYLEGQSQPKGFVSLSAPIGLSCSWGIEKLGALGFFVPLIDVGAVTTYRFNDNNTADLPELSWGNIFSPGLYLVYNLPKKLPLALGYGAQSGPNLRKVTVGGLENRSAWRHGFFATVDIPITYFYLGKGKKY